MKQATRLSLAAWLVGCGSLSESMVEQPGQDSGEISMANDAGTGFAKVAADRMTFEWRVEGNVLRGRMTARTLGWVTVGFNRARELKGTRLIMGYVQGGRTVVEEHIADPPNHRPKVELGGKNAVLSATGREEGGSTTIEFTLELDPGDGFVPLVSGEHYHTTLAWSHEDDLYHHSAMRTAVDLTL